MYLDGDQAAGDEVGEESAGDRRCREEDDGDKRATLEIGTTAKKTVAVVKKTDTRRWSEMLETDDAVKKTVAAAKDRCREDKPEMKTEEGGTVAMEERDSVAG
ncbi:Heat shock protein GrpE [Sesbania bispinosa]|nr:Heat shock protein GrpE [Sesbania bispinosa]